ncbi:MAG: aryl-sulfate sulfotransferase [Acidimicrobiia bacterium]|nr:aryl-sulfate sulfotransferase [Acidimicrobiia bacterium]
MLRTHKTGRTGPAALIWLLVVTMTFVSAPVGAGVVPGVDVSVGPVAVFPAFAEDHHDYGVRCAAGVNALDVTVTAPGAGSITVDGAVVDSGTTVVRNVSAGDATVVAVDGVEYWHRCLPDDWPVYTIDRPAEPGPGYYLVMFGWFTAAAIDPSGTFVAVLDTYGVPVWYKRTRDRVIDQKLLSDGTIAWQETSSPRSYEMHELDGSITRVVRADGIDTDNHEYLELPNGNDLVMSYVPRPGVDLTALGLTANETALDGYLQEVDPDGNAVWEWRSQDHIAVEETIFSTTDLIHLNSAERTAAGDYLISGRSVGVYLIDGTTKAIKWKLGGSTTPESLTLVNDPLGGPTYQHDARMLPDGTVTIFDNRSFTMGEGARAVQYEIDTTAIPPTATLIWEKPRADLFASFFIGAARRQPDGNTVITWGGLQPLFEEVDILGDRLFALEMTGHFLYRAVKYPLSAFDIAELRANAGGTAESQAPTNVVGTPAYERVVVSWTAPTAQIPVVDYTVTAAPDGASCTTTGATTCTVSGLTNGVDYTFSVIATNTGGPSPASFDSAPVAPIDDVIDPAAAITVPADGAAYPAGTTVIADYACTDETNGSGLASCLGDVADGDPLDTLVQGTHDFTVTATDNDGNQTQTVHSYTIGPPETTRWYFNNSLTGGPADLVRDFGTSLDHDAAIGDWDGNGIDDLAVRRGNLFMLFDMATQATSTIGYGRAGDEVFVGDWDGDGIDTLAIRRGNNFHIRNSVTSGPADVTIAFGRAGDEVLVGDWDGDGIDTLAVRRGNVIFVRNSISTGVADTVFAFGRAADVLLRGDWDGDGIDTLAVRRGRFFHIRSSLTTGVADLVFAYGLIDDDVHAGDWNGDGVDTFVARRGVAV